MVKPLKEPRRGDLALGILITVVMIAVGLSFMVETVKIIPQNAQIVVSPSEGCWLPDAPFMADFFLKHLADPTMKLSEAAAKGQRYTTATWKDVQHGPYQGFVLPPGVGTYKDNFQTDGGIVIFYSLIGLRPERWNDDGTWNY